MLSGCTFTLFGKTITLFEKDSSSGGSGSGGSGSGGSGGGGGGDVVDKGREVSTGGAKSSTEASSDAVVLDFTDTSWKDEQITPYVTGEAGKMYTFTFGGLEYNDIGCFASRGYNDGDPNYLMMKNKDYESGDKYGNGNWSNKPAFIGNAEPFDKPIKKVIVEVGSGSSGNTLYRASIHTKAQEECAASGGFTAQGAGTTFYTETTSSEGYYFTVSTNKNSEGKLYNGQIFKVTVSF